MCNPMLRLHFFHCLILDCVLLRVKEIETDLLITLKGEHLKEKNWNAGCNRQVHVDGIYKWIQVCFPPPDP